MSRAAQFLSPSDAARRLGVSAKALRLYEQRGLIAPLRTAAGWRAFGPDAMARAAEIVKLRALGLSLGQVARVLEGDAHVLDAALAAHETTLEGRARELTDAMAKVREMRARIGQGETPTAHDLARLLDPGLALSVEFSLPWPWGGERFELRDIRSLTYIVGPLGSGKTRLAKRIAEAIPDAEFLGVERLADHGVAARAKLDADPALKSRVDRTLAWIVEDGGAVSGALIVLLAELEAERPAVLVIDMLEQGLDKPTQQALVACLRRRAPGRRPFFFLTRSSAILDLDSVGADETIVLCPANHSPPMRVTPYPGSPGYEAVATCLASPEVRARTEGVIAWRPQMA